MKDLIASFRLIYDCKTIRPVRASLEIAGTLYVCMCNNGKLLSCVTQCFCEGETYPLGHPLSSPLHPSASLWGSNVQCFWNEGSQKGTCSLSSSSTLIFQIKAMWTCDLQVKNGQSDKSEKATRTDLLSRCLQMNLTLHRDCCSGLKFICKLWSKQLLT